MSEQPEWIQCATCARHVRASDERCPFCARDAGASSVVRPAAVVIAALAALAPMESSAESNYRSQRSAQSRMTSAYGAPAPAYGLAPVRPTTPAIDASVESISVSTSNVSPRIRTEIMGSRQQALTCATQAPSLMPDNTVVQVRLRVEPRAGVAFKPQVASRSPDRGTRAVVACLRASLARIAWTRDPARVVSATWSYRFMRPARVPPGTPGDPQQGGQ